MFLDQIDSPLNLLLRFVGVFSGFAFFARATTVIERLFNGGILLFSIGLLHHKHRFVAQNGGSVGFQNAGIGFNHAL